MTTPVAAMASALIARVRAAGIGWLADKLVWETDPRVIGGLVAKAEIAKGQLSVTVQPSLDDEQQAQGAVTWSGNRCFSCGAYTDNGDRLVWDLAAAVQFASSHGVLPSEGDR